MIIPWMWVSLLAVVPVILVREWMTTPRGTRPDQDGNPTAPRIGPS